MARERLAQVLVYAGYVNPYGQIMAKLYPEGFKPYDAYKWSSARSYAQNWF